MTQSHDFLAKIQKRKSAIHEKEEQKVVHDINQDAPKKGKPMDLPKKSKPVPAKAPKVAKKTEDELEHTKATIKVTEVKKSDKKKCKDIEHNHTAVEATGNTQKVSESIFVLAGIEDILGDEIKRAGAHKALTMVGEYLDGILDDASKEYIELFKSAIAPRPAKTVEAPKVEGI